MAEIKNSVLFDQIMNDARKIEITDRELFTVERFAVAVIDAVNREIVASDMELSALNKVVRKSFGDLDDAREALMEYIRRDTHDYYGEETYMFRKFNEAKRVAAQTGSNEVDTVIVLLCVLHDPNETIRKLLDAADEYEGDGDSVRGLAVKDLFDDDEDVFTLSDFLDEASPAPKEQMSRLVADVKRIRKQLQSFVCGQDNAINQFVTGYFQANMLSMIDHGRKRPKATFLFAGPPGVGKTFLAEKAAEALGKPFMRFDMSEYSDKEANIEFCGSDKVYKNGKAGNVTSFVAKHPDCVLLFDEIEKAHLCVIHLFLQMLDAGRLRDNFTDEEVSFTDAVIILTTNAGKQLYEGSESGDLSNVSKKVVIKALRQDVNPATGAPYFPGAICSRFASGNVVMFNHIQAHDLRNIAQKEIERHASNLERETGIQLHADDRVYTALLFSDGSAADARTVRGRAEAFFNNELYELLRLIASDKTETDITDIEDISISLDFNTASPEISRLFNMSEKPVVLLFADEELAEMCQKKAQGFDIIRAEDADTAVSILKEQNVDFILLDVKNGDYDDNSHNLNVADVDSPARDFFKFLKEKGNETPVYLLERIISELTDEEKVSFKGQGVRGVIRIGMFRDSFAAQLNSIAASIHQQQSMNRLAKENKLVSFETAQTISNDGKRAEIKLFDFRLAVAVDSEDAKNILSSVSKPNVRFDDVIGATDAKNELKYFIEYLKNPKKYMGTGLKAPKGVLLYGPPGTGKTMLAKAMACEAGVTFIAAEGNQFLKKYVGEGSEKVHELFRTARKYAPSVLFIDEIDAIAKERSGGMTSFAGGEETLTAFLTEMDGFTTDPSRPVFVLAATNFEVEPGKAKSLDPALMRRFDRRVYIDLPAKADRLKFLESKVKSNPALDISENQMENICVRSTGMSLAQLDSVIDFALRTAVRNGSTVVNDSILEEAFETFNNGEEKKWDASQLERVARHEAGHALLCALGGETPSYLTIVARGDHGGYMQHGDTEGKAIFTKDELLARIRTSLGGRAAEIVCYGERDGVSTGASGDFLSATHTARQIVCTYGMDDDFGLAVIPADVAVSGPMSPEVRTAVNRILRQQMDEAVRLLSENKDKLELLVKALLEKNSLGGKEIEKLLN